MISKSIAEKPVFFEKNRVYRVYLGGKQFSELCGDDSIDGMFPEEWIASNVKAINPKYFGERDGVSVVKGEGIYFDDLLAEHKELLLGRYKFDCLVKYLDSAIRLPVQVHPTKEFSQKHFNSNYGKTEAWLVIATRPNAKIYFGFKNKITKDDLWKLEEKSEHERDIMSTVLNSVDAKVGDMYLINAGLIHAIGAGCTILEVQEPTDFTIQPEAWCGDYHISDNEKYIGLDKTTALDCFNFDMYGEKAILASKISPKSVIKCDGYEKEILISYDNTPCFAENRHILTGGSFVVDFAPSAWICLSGEATIKGEQYENTIKKGDYFFMPHCCKGKFEIKGNATLIECLPSKQ